MDETAAGEVVPMRRPGSAENPADSRVDRSADLPADTQADLPAVVPADSSAGMLADSPAGMPVQGVGEDRGLAEEEGRVVGRITPAPLSALDVADMLIGLVAVSVVRSQRLVDRVRGVARPLSPLARPVRALGERLFGAGRVQDVLALGRSQRLEAGRVAEATARRFAPRLVDDALGLVDLTALVRDHVDLDELAADLDVDAVVARADIEAVLDRVDIDAVAARVNIEAILDRVDIDAVAARVDIEPILQRVDIDAVAARVDIEAILDRVDIDAVAARVNIEAILDRVDIDAVAARLDLDAVAARLDLDAVVARLDLIALAEYVVEGIDLPGIIQSSTGAMASESLREVRWQGVSADERVAHVVDRMLHRKPRAPGAALPSDTPSVPPGPPGPVG